MQETSKEHVACHALPSLTLEIASWGPGVADVKVWTARTCTSAPIIRKTSCEAYNQFVAERTVTKTLGPCLFFWQAASRRLCVRPTEQQLGVHLR